MMKNQIIISLLLTSLLLLQSCGDSSQTTEDSVENLNTEPVTEAATDDPLYQPNLPKNIDLDGYEYRISTYGGGNTDYIANYIEIENTDGTIVNDAAFQRNAELEDMLNIKMRCIEDPNPANSFAFNQTLFKQIMAGDDFCDAAIIWCDTSYTSLITEHAILDITSLPYIDLSKGYYNHSFNDLFDLNGKHFFIGGGFPFPCSPDTYMLFHETKWSSYDLDDPYQLVRDGKWTHETVRTIVKDMYQDLNGDGKSNDGDFFGICTDNTDVYTFAMIAYGVNPVRYENNTFVFDIASEHAVSAFEKLMELSDKTITKYDKSWESFRDENALLCIYNSGIDFIRELPFDVGMLPMPKYDEDQVSYCTNGLQQTLCVPVTISDLEKTGMITEALYAVSHRYMPEAVVTNLAENKVLRNADSVEMYRLMRDNCHFYLTSYLWFGDFYRMMFYDGLMSKQNADIASEWAKKQSSVMKQADSILAALIENESQT